MAACAFKQESEFKKLVRQVGSEELATYTYFAYNGYPEMQTNTALRSKVGVPYAAFNDGIWRIAQKVRRYNAHNGTAHYFTKKRIGQSAQYKIEFKANYLPVNIEKQRQRDLARSERDKAWYDFQQKDFTNLTQKDLEQYARLKQLVESDTVEEVVQEEVYGINESVPELEVHVLGNNQYMAAGEIYPTYQDALNAVDNDPWNLSDVGGEVITAPQELDLELQSDLENMYPTNRLLDYLFSESSQTLSDKEFKKRAGQLMLRLKSEGYTNAGIIDAIKCL